MCEPIHDAQKPTLNANAGSSEPSLLHHAIRSKIVSLVLYVHVYDNYTNQAANKYLHYAYRIVYLSLLHHPLSKIRADARQCSVGGRNALKKSSCKILVDVE